MRVLIRKLKLRLTPAALHQYTAYIVRGDGKRIAARAYAEEYGAKWDSALHRNVWNNRAGAEFYCYVRNFSNDVTATIALPKGTTCRIERIR